jgi:hypothetical protein
MWPGPIEIKRCEKCSGFLKVETYISMNTMGARFWTDGKMEAPMYKCSDSLVVCSHCYKLIWINKLKKISSPTDIMYQQSQQYELPKFSDFMSFLIDNNLSKEEELYVRKKAWIAGNDVRRSKPFTIALSSSEKDNLIRLDEDFNPNNVSEYILKAEIKRELGFFKQALETILMVKKSFKTNSDELCHMEFIEYLSSLKISSVKEMVDFEEVVNLSEGKVKGKELYFQNHIYDFENIAENKGLQLNQAIKLAQEKELALINAIASNPNLSDYLFEKLKIIDIEIKEMLSIKNDSTTYQENDFKSINLEL